MSDDYQTDWLARWNLYSPKKVALKDASSGKAFTYKNFFSIANGLGLYLRSLGVCKGDRVAVFSQNKVETVFLFFALQRLGAILVPINFRLTAKEADFVLEDSGSKFLFIDQEFSSVQEKLKSTVQSFSMLNLETQCKASLDQPRVLPFLGDFDSPCKILYTSGTTGFPKGVVITPKILFWNSMNTSLSLNLTSDDVTVNFSPFFHTGGWNVLLTPFIHRGATVILLPKFDADQVLQVCQEEAVTLFFGVPTTLGLMSESVKFKTANLSRVRYAIVGGEPMPISMIQLWHKKGISIRQGFGLTECGPNCFSLSQEDAETKIGSIGRPNFYVQTRVVDKSGAVAEAGQVGELFLKGPMCMTEYWGNPQATADGFVDGWLRTGDLVKVDKDNYFFVVGRKKEMFISGGENVYPAEIETVMTQHPNISEVAVLGVKDEKWGEVGKAFFTTLNSESMAPEDLIDFCRDRIARYKIPKHFEFMSELPKGDSGKILKKELIDKFI